MGDITMASGKILMRIPLQLRLDAVETDAPHLNVRECPFGDSASVVLELPAECNGVVKLPAAILREIIQRAAVLPENTDEVASLEQIVSDIQGRPGEVGRIAFVFATEDRRHIGYVLTKLTGSESLDALTEACTDALMVARRDLAEREGYRPTGEGWDGKPRTRREKAAAAFMNRIATWDPVTPHDEMPEFQEFMAARTEEIETHPTKFGGVPA